MEIAGLSPGYKRTTRRGAKLGSLSFKCRTEKGAMADHAGSPVQFCSHLCGRMLPATYRATSGSVAPLRVAILVEHRVMLSKLWGWRNRAPLALKLDRNPHSRDDAGLTGVLHISD